MCTKASMPMQVKLIDFGLGRCISQGLTSQLFADKNPGGNEDDGLGPEGLMMTPVGTPHFVAPEVLSSLPYGKEVDLFSCGVILYWLLSAKLPFDDSNHMKLVESIKHANLDFSDPLWYNVSPNAKDLIKGLLDGSPVARLSAVVALAHPWFSHERSKSSMGLVSPIPGDELIVNEWKADPAFQLGSTDTSKPTSPIGTLVRNLSSGLAWSISSPVTPHRHGGSDATLHYVELHD